MLCSSICGHYDVEKNAQCGDQPKLLAWHGGGHPQMGDTEKVERLLMREAVFKGLSKQTNVHKTKIQSYKRPKEAGENP
ncbi:unnamed protein product [Arctogadus glacialis]